MNASEQFMKRALLCAKKAAALGEVPVGAVVVLDGKVIATGYNRRETGKNALLHAEMIALQRACRKVEGWRLEECDLYVTLEPCPMCAGALINARIRRVYIGAMDEKGGCMGSLCDLTQLPFNHRPEVVRGVLKEECEKILTDFFHRLREKKRPVRATVTLRSFTQQDVPVLHRYLYPKLSLKQISETVADWNSLRYEGAYCEFFAVISGEEIPVGYVNLFERSDGRISVGAHIFAGFRGKSYGTQAVRLALQIAREKGYVTAHARVRKTNTPSNRLCHTVGFVPVGDDVTKDGNPVTVYEMKL